MAMIIDATLQRLVLSSPQPDELASFYRRALGFAIDTHIDTHIDTQGGQTRCEAPERSIWLSRGPANQLLSSHFCLRDRAAFDRYVRQLAARNVACTGGDAEQIPEISVTDPEGRRLCFRPRANLPPGADIRPRARLQHYAVRTPHPQALLEFYVEQLGFALSDLVRDGAGELSAAFLRTDAEHHVLAIFRAPAPRFDHFSCEAANWTELRDWADHMSGESIALAWGIGRHGPGNDTFFMVRDPDGNLAEISSDLERCDPGRPVGLWPHRPETLNRWGLAIMRS